MASLLRIAMKAVREKGIGGFPRDLKEERYMKCLLDGNLLRYGIEHMENFFGEGDKYIYHSKGHTLNPGQRDWTAYQPWQPTKT